MPHILISSIVKGSEIPILPLANTMAPSHPFPSASRRPDLPSRCRYWHRGNIEDYVHNNYSVAKFKKAYESM
jgi:hypothetical protein